MDTSASFGTWLRRRRRGLDWTQRQLGERVGYSEHTIRKIEADELRPSREMAEALAEAKAAIAKSRDGLYGSGSLWLQKAEALRGLGRYDEARAAYQRAITNDGPMSEAGQRLQTLPR